MSHVWYMADVRGTVRSGYVTPPNTVRMRMSFGCNELRLIYHSHVIHDVQQYYEVTHSCHDSDVLQLH